VHATVTVPGSKSQTNRALVLAALATPNGTSTVSGALRSRDTDLMIGALQALGVAVDVNPEAAKRIEQRRDRADAGLLVAVEQHRLGAQRGHRRDEAEDRARQAAFDARARPRSDGAADRQLGALSVDVHAERLQRADHQVGVAAA